jgi:hypothetical protein
LRLLIFNLGIGLILAVLIWYMVKLMLVVIYLIVILMRNEKNMNKIIRENQFGGNRYDG